MYLVGNDETIRKMVSSYGQVKTGYITKRFNSLYENKNSSTAFDFTSALFEHAHKEKVFERYLHINYSKIRKK